MFTATALRRISQIVLLTFTSMTLQPLQAAVMAEPASAPAPQSTDQRYGKSLEEISELLQGAVAKQDRGQSDDTEVAQLRSKKLELDALEAEAAAGFAAVGQHLVDNHLPAEILARHQAALAEFNTRQAELKQALQAEPSWHL